MNSPAKRATLFKKTDPSVVESFPLRVDEYDLTTSPHCVYGTRLDTNEAVTVYLDQDPALLHEVNRGEHKRPEIENFAAPRVEMTDPGTEVGGTLFIQSAKDMGGRVFKSKWINVLSHYQDETEIVMGTVHYHGVDYFPGSQRTVGRVTLVYDFDNSALTDQMYAALGNAQPAVVQTANELREALIRLLDARMGAGVRMIAPNGEFDAVFIREQRDTTPSAVAVDSFLAAKLPDGFARMIESREVTVEVIPIKTLFLGGKTALDIYQKIEAHGGGGAYDGDLATISRYRSSTTTDAGHPRNNMHFGKTLLGLRLSKPDDAGNRGIFITHIKPLFPRNETLIGLGDALAYAHTGTFAPTKVFSDVLPGHAATPQEHSEAAQPESAAAPPSPLPPANPSPSVSASRPPVVRERFRASR